MFVGAQSPAGALHYGLLLADGVLLLLAVGLHLMVLLVLRVRVHFVVLRVLMGVHFLVLLMLRVGVHFRVLLMRGEGIHFVVLLVLAVGVHLVVRLMGLQLVAGGVRQHRLEQVRRLAGLIRRGVHEGHGGLGLRVLLLLQLRRFPRIRDLGALLGLLLQLHLVGGHLGMRRHVLAVRGVLGGEGVLGVRVAAAVVDNGAKAVVVVEVRVHLLGAASSVAVSAAPDGPVAPLLLRLRLMMVLMLLLLFLQRHLQLVVEPRDGASRTCVSHPGSGRGAVRAYDALGVVPLLGCLAHVVAHPFARIAGRGHRLRLRLCLLGRLLSVVMGSLGGRACLRLQQMLDQELVVVVHFLLGPLGGHAHHGRVGLRFGGAGMIRLRLGGGASGVRVRLRGREKSRRED